MIFKSSNHEQLFKVMQSKSDYTNDPEKLSCFYLLALVCDFHKSDYALYYDFERDEIKPNSINNPEITGASSRALRLAYILYNGFPSGEPYNGINNIFGYSALDVYFLEALRIRYNIGDNREEQQNIKYTSGA